MTSPRPFASRPLNGANSQFSLATVASEKAAPAISLFALVALPVLALTCDHQPQRSDNRSHGLASNGGNAVIVRKVLALADVPISVTELEDETYHNKITNAHRKVRLLLAEYTGGDSAALEEDVG